jgi:RNA polymerase sigma-70 factor, ECF subfamily
VFTHHTDEALMRAIATRDERAFAVLYDRYGTRMYRFFLRMLGRDAAKAEDFTQELFLKIIEKPHLFDSNRSFRTWIYVVATNMCKNEYRRAANNQVIQPEILPETWEEPLPERLDQSIFEADLHRSIGELNENQRQCFVLRYQEELSVPEISEIIGCPEGTVKSRLHHALRQITTAMKMWRSS